MGSTPVAKESPEARELAVAQEGSASSAEEESALVEEEVEAAEKAAASPEQAFELYFPMVWRGLRRLGVAEAALDDAAQDVFLVLHRRWGDFDGRSSMRTWVYGIAVRVASDHTRRARRDSGRFNPLETELSSTLATPDKLYQQREAGRMLHRALEKLPEKERQLLVLVDLEEQSVVEAAEAAGIKLNTAYTRLRRARVSFEKAVQSLVAEKGGPV